MSDTWITDITHFLDEDGHIVSVPAEAKRMGDYFAAIVMMASFSEPDYPPEYKVSCRRRPNRKPCKEEIVGWIEPDGDDIFWICSKCQDRGRISNWRGTIYDMSNIGEIFH